MNLVRKAITLSRRILTPPRAEHAHRVACLLINPTHEELAAAYLHDIFEDTEYKTDRLKEQFGEKITTWVVALTNPADMRQFGVRDFSHLKDVCSEVKRIKLADRIDNIKKRVYHEVPHLDYSDYVEETEKLLEIIQDGDSQLAALLRNLVEKLKNNCTKYKHGNLLQVSPTANSKTSQIDGRAGEYINPD
jgi:(p)ppGpp synthase/HD superfamily hydrolase